MANANPVDQARAIRERQMAHDFYRSGIDHYAGEYDEAAMFDFINQMPHITQTTTSPWINVTDDARQSTYNAYMEDNYNPFIGNEGAWVTPEGNDLRGSNNGTAEGYRDDSISAYLKNAFAGQDQVQNRANALRAFKKWNGTERGINPVTTRMSQSYFDDLGLGNFGLAYQETSESPQDPVHSSNDGKDETSTGMMSSSWLDVMQDGVTAFNEKWNANRRGGPAVAGMLGGLAGGPGIAPRPNNNLIQEEWSKLPNEGMMKRSGPNRDLVYSKLMEKLGG